MGKPTRRLWRLWPIGIAGHTGTVVATRWAPAQELDSVYRRLLKMTLEELQGLEQQISQ